DYSTPIWEPIRKKFITRHRLEKKNPLAQRSEAKEPIIYYLDPGTPEPVRSALLEGASWWNQAFDAIGYIDAFQVKMLPEDADPMDVRYNVIQWVHRSTRGWSYGGTVIDPRTGEIIKGHVSLGSLRIRQDFMIAQALMNKPFASRDDNHGPMLDMALARIRQLSAHEVGHTLGFAHNFAASAKGRVSVMDYPHPALRIINESIDFGNAYATGIGDWDKVTVAYSYGNTNQDIDEELYLRMVLLQAQSDGLRFISDSDARAMGGAHVSAHLWDNGISASEELKNVLRIRKVAIENFSAENIQANVPYSVLEDVFVPLYFYHRYQTEAAIKLVGGMDYSYYSKGETGIVQEHLPKKIQQNALDITLQTLDVDALTIPRRLLELFPPRAYGYPRTRESFKSKMGVAFDALSAAETAGDMTLKLLLHPQRANRLTQQHAIDPSNLGLKDILQPLTARVKRTLRGSDYEREVQKSLQFTILNHLLKLYNNKESIPQVKAMTRGSLQELKRDLLQQPDDWSQWLAGEIIKFEKDPLKFEFNLPPKIPDGSPIGSFECPIFE
ncbi:MAG: zinc-dependent metalloprotease, partial [Bacteroidia bacterium]|nr:zinc-dependent metalloprotease [Bacteroidia bacterium]